MNLWHFLTFFCVELVAAVPYLTGMWKNRKRLQDSKASDFALFLLVSSGVFAAITLPHAPTTADVSLVATNGLAGGIIAIILQRRCGYVWNAA